MNLMHVFSFRSGGKHKSSFRSGGKYKRDQTVSYVLHLLITWQ